MHSSSIRSCHAGRVQSSCRSCHAHDGSSSALRSPRSRLFTSCAGVTTVGTRMVRTECTGCGRTDRHRTDPVLRRQGVMRLSTPFGTPMDSPHVGGRELVSKTGTQVAGAIRARFVWSLLTTLAPGSVPPAPVASPVQSFRFDARSNGTRPLRGRLPAVFPRRCTALHITGSAMRALGLAHEKLKQTGSGDRSLPLSPDLLTLALQLPLKRLPPSEHSCQSTCANPCRSCRALGTLGKHLIPNRNTSEVQCMAQGTSERALTLL